MTVVSFDASQARRTAYSVVLGQAAVTVVAALLSFAIAGRLAAVSALIGGGISTLASFAMAALAFRESAAASPQHAMRAFFIGEAVKIAVVVVLFVWVLRNVKVSPLAMFAAYMATFLVFWVALANASPKSGRGSSGGGASARGDG